MDAEHTLDTLPDDAFQEVFAACGTRDGVPLFEEVKGLGRLSKGMRQQLQRLRPLVGVQSLIVMQRPAHGPWRVVLFYIDDYVDPSWHADAIASDMEVLVEQARQGHVHSINFLPPDCTAENDPAYGHRRRSAAAAATAAPLLRRVGRRVALGRRLPRVHVRRVHVRRVCGWRVRSGGGAGRLLLLLRLREQEGA